MEALRERRFGDPGPRLAETGEVRLLDRLLTAPRAVAPVRGLVVGPGDDAAVWTHGSGEAVVITQDALVEGVDFHRGWTTPHRLGRRALTVSLSDLAAMGATPYACVATVCASQGTALDDVVALQLGIIEAGAAVGCALVGGDVSAIEGPLVVDVCAVGGVSPGAVLRRDAGRPGDRLVVTGTLGRAAAGLRILLCHQELRDDPVLRAPRADYAAWLTAQLDPVARLSEGRALAAARVGCAGDVSDGLLVDAARTAAASGCGAELWLDRVPVDAALVSALPEEWPALALAGGEDFELLAAVGEAPLDALLAGWGGAPLSVVGRLVEGDGVRLLDREGGGVMPSPRPRSRHFDA